MNEWAIAMVYNLMCLLIYLKHKHPILHIPCVFPTLLPFFTLYLISLVVSYHPGLHSTCQNPGHHSRETINSNAWDFIIKDSLYQRMSVHKSGHSELHLPVQLPRAQLSGRYSCLELSSNEKDHLTCWSLDLECLPIAHVLKAWSPRWYSWGRG